ncbi:hypothetical protein VDGD_07279 [Verticillium dahliae]|nr:hypothetical protein VDGD_07279 [Verticillium dahliae]
MQTPAPAGRDGSESESESMHTARSRADSEARRDPSRTGTEADTTAKSDGYEVVDVNDSEEDAGREDQSTPKPEQAARPKLPRLNSQSRASSSFVGSETDTQDHAEAPRPQPEQESSRPTQPEVAAASQQRSPQGGAQNSARPNTTSQDHSQSQNTSQASQDQGGPSHINTSREIPIPIRKQEAGRHSITTDEDDDDDASSVSSSSTESIGNRAQYYDHHQPPQHSPTPVTRSTLKNKSDDEENPTIQIPKVTPLASGLTLPPNLAELAENLEDKYIDEFGNVLEWDGRVLGRVEGDLPSMIGRPVSATGEVISTEGQVVGYVAENDTIAPRPPSPKPIHGMGEGMKLDHMGNILNRHNKIVGHLNAEELVDAPEPIRRARNGGGGGSGGGGGGGGGCGCSCGHGRAKPSAAPSPSEIYLDVKSTNDGVQLIIKIPTVFNGGGTPNIHIGTSS